MIKKMEKKEQIKAVLLSASVGYAKWSEKNYGISWKELTENFTYNDIFSITVKDVYDFVKDRGWNYYSDEIPEISDLVVILSNLPQDYNPPSAVWIFLPLDDNGYPLVTFGSYDRAPWKIWYFETKKDRDIDLIQKLLDQKKSSFG